MYYLYWKVIRENGFVPYLGGCRISEVPLLEAYLYTNKKHYPLELDLASVAG